VLRHAVAAEPDQDAVFRRHATSPPLLARW
jgi:hypothetical protein